MYYTSINNYEEWLEKARMFLYADILPSKIYWDDANNPQSSLFRNETQTSLLSTQKKVYQIPLPFFNLAKNVALYRENTKWHLLYETLWRIARGEKNLLKVSSDPLVHQLLLIEKKVRRDAHKMKAFVRFRLYEEAGNHYYIAWHQPDHLIVRKTAPFFRRRFEVMNWTIITPDESALWDGKSLKFLPGIKDFKHTSEDELEDLWCTYYRSIFNPARIKIKMMRQEMPVRYWQNLPETKIISDMLKEAPERVSTMLKYTEGFSHSAKDYLPESLDYPALKSAAHQCKACPLYKKSTQTVFGYGNTNAKILIVAEQPGNEEDKAGIPLIGASGDFLKTILKSLNVDLESIYFTNAVKHFKHELLNQKIIYKSPTIKEIYACKPWLEAEINLVNPKVILCLGLIAAKSLINPGFHLKEQRKNIHYYNAIPIISTYHPAAILRSKEVETKKILTQWFTTDIERALSIAQF